MPLFNFFVRRFEGETFELTAEDLNTEYADFWPKMLMKCLWCNYERRTTHMTWLGMRNNHGIPKFVEETGSDSAWG